jgi:MoaA/NifB/PqqE/SkfB family radical SAM enzyme
MISTIFLELTNYCNMNCEFCADHLMTRPRGCMNLDLAKSVIDQLKKIDFKGTLITSLMGEPLIHPNFKEILNYSISSGIKTNVITNFLLVQKKITIKELLSAGIDTLCLSYQTPDKNSFLMRHTKVPFDEYFNKLEEIISFARDNYHKTNRIEIHILQSLYNYLNVEIVNDYSLIESSIIELCDVLNFNPLKSSNRKFGRKDLTKALKSFQRGKQYLDTFEIQIGSGIYAVLKRANTWANCLVPKDCEIEPKERTSCGFFNNTLGILWDGKCTVCCQDFNGSIYIGNAASKPIKDIIMGDRLTYFREKNKKSQLCIDYCKNCKGIIKRDAHNFSIIKNHGLMNKAFQLANRIKVKLNN